MSLRFSTRRRASRFMRCLHDQSLPNPQAGVEPDSHLFHLFQAVQPCLGANNHLVLWLSRFLLAWDYPLLQVRCLVRTSYTVSKLSPPPLVYTRATTAVKGRLGPSPWSAHIGWAARLQRHAGASRLTNHTSCIHTSKVCFRLGG